MLDGQNEHLSLTDYFFKVELEMDSLPKTMPEGCRPQNRTRESAMRFE